jgi:hypothetical protein
VGHFDFDGNHEKRSIIYPGFKGRPSDVPFAGFHEYFKRRVSKVTHMLFIGFAFRDEYINELLRGWTSPTASIAIIDPVRPATTPFPQAPVHLGLSFGEAPRPASMPAVPDLVAEVNDWFLGIAKARGST